jgi:ABC-type multidrug transport system ATPase subunit
MTRTGAEGKAGEDASANTNEDGNAMTDGGETVVAVEDVTKQFGSVTALDGVSLTADGGEVTALVGPNGSGKTTLLRMVAGLLPPTTGRVETVGTARPVGYLPQSPAFRPAFSVEGTVTFYAGLLSADVDVASTLDRVGLSALRGRRVDALSGGMTRLLGIAQATLGDPDLVVLDEPTGDLDPRMTEYVFEVVEELAADGMAVLLATHDLAGAAASDRVVVLDRGTVRVSGTPGEVTAEANADTLPAAFHALVRAEAELTVRAGAER